MRKAYGPTGISYRYPIDEFINDCKNGLKDNNGADVGAVVTELNDKGDEKGIKKIFDEADCVGYDKDGKKCMFVGS